MKEHAFLISLLLNVKRRQDCKFIFKDDEVAAVVAKMLWYFSGIPPRLQSSQRLSNRRKEDLRLAASILNRFPIYAGPENGETYWQHVIDTSSFPYYLNN